MFPKDTRELASVLWIDRGNVIIYYMNLACAKLLTVKNVFTNVHRQWIYKLKINDMDHPSKLPPSRNTYNNTRCIYVCVCTGYNKFSN